MAVCQPPHPTECRTTFHGRTYLLARSTNATARTATAAAYCQLRLPGSTLGARRGFTLPLQFASQASKFKTYDALTSTVCIGLRCKAFSVIECVPSGKRRARYDPVTNNLVGIRRQQAAVGAGRGCPGMPARDDRSMLMRCSTARSATHAPSHPHTHARTHTYPLVHMQGCQNKGTGNVVSLGAVRCLALGRDVACHCMLHLQPASSKRPRLPHTPPGQLQLGIKLPGEQQWRQERDWRLQHR